MINGSVYEQERRDNKPTWLSQALIDALRRPSYIVPIIASLPLHLPLPLSLPLYSAKDWNKIEAMAMAWSLAAGVVISAVHFAVLRFQ